MRNSLSMGASELKSRIIMESMGTDNGINASPEQKEVIENLVAQLIPLNKVNDIAASKLMNGTWETVYTTNREFSAGKAGPFIGEVQQYVYQDLTLYENHLSLANDLVHATLRGTWEPISGNTWKIIFKDVSLKLFGFKVLSKPFENAIGIWRTVYLDDTMRIFFAKNANKEEAEENLYVLRRQGSSLK